MLGGSATSFAVGNARGVAAKKLVVTIVLSTDRKRDARDVVIGTATLKGLKAKGKRTLGITEATRWVTQRDPPRTVPESDAEPPKRTSLGWRVDPLVDTLPNAAAISRRIFSI